MHPSLRLTVSPPAPRLPCNRYGGEDKLLAAAEVATTRGRAIGLHSRATDPASAQRGRFGRRLARASPAATVTPSAGSSGVPSAEQARRSAALSAVQFSVGAGVGSAGARQRTAAEEVEMDAVYEAYRHNSDLRSLRAMWQWLALTHDRQSRSDSASGTATNAASDAAASGRAAAPGTPASDSTRSSGAAAGPGAGASRLGGSGDSGADASSMAAAGAGVCVMLGSKLGLATAAAAAAASAAAEAAATANSESSPSVTDARSGEPMDIGGAHVPRARSNSLPEAVGSFHGYVNDSRLGALRICGWATTSARLDKLIAR